MTRKKTFISDLAEGQSVTDFLAVAQAQRKEAKNGPYWQLTLSDRTGSIEARIWAPQSLQISTLNAEDIVHISGQTALFKDQLQLNVTSLTVVDPEELGLDFADFLPSSAVPPRELLERMEELLHRELSFKPWKTLCSSILGDHDIRAALLRAPGAKSIHHAYAGGLLEHTLGVMRICLALAELYPDADKEILLVGALLHDLGKAFELTHGISREYTDAGRLLGHIQLGLEVLDPFLHRAKNLPEGLALHLRHLLISHHGELEYGSPRRPKTMEAFILHYADNLDAKINTVQNALSTTDDDAPEHGRWSDYQRSLSRFVYAPPRTPAPIPRREEYARANEKRPSAKSVDAPLLKAMGIHPPTTES